ncbi:MAG: TIGR03936 family radical SAM-associated protein [Chloroflexota bacterium]|nr:TIGR03936 family radical SAM-associated protein [Chloroflexota bacterium]
MIKLRVTFSKGGRLTYTSHLDLARAWERALRRAGLPLAYSQGFNPRPKLQLAAALPLGHTGEAELLDVQMERPVTLEDFAKSLTPVLPDGLMISQVRQVRLKEPALQTQIRSAEYRVTVEWYPEPAEKRGELVEQVEARIERVLAATELPQERRGRRYDLRPLIERLWLEQTDRDQVVLGMQLAARTGATARPEAVLEALGMSKAFAHCHRRRLLIDT